MFLHTDKVSISFSKREDELLFYLLSRAGVTFGQSCDSVCILCEHACVKALSFGVWSGTLLFCSVRDWREQVQKWALLMTFKLE